MSWNDHQYNGLLQRVQFAFKSFFSLIPTWIFKKFFSSTCHKHLTSHYCTASLLHKENWKYLLNGYTLSLKCKVKTYPRRYRILTLKHHVMRWYFKCLCRQMTFIQVCKLGQEMLSIDSYINLEPAPTKSFWLKLQ